MCLNNLGPALQQSPAPHPGHGLLANVHKQIAAERKIVYYKENIASRRDLILSISTDH